MGNLMQGMQLKAAYYTLGCKLNYAETSAIGKTLSSFGISEIRKGETPDLCVVNTCSVTETADKKGRSLIRRVARQYPHATIVVTGCYAQLKPEEVAAIPGVDIVVGSNDKHRIAELLAENGAFDRSSRKKSSPTASIVAPSELTSDVEFHPSCARGDRTRYFLKVQDGCDYYCTYCTIPYARGRSRSGSVDEIVAQAREAAADGGREIVLTGVNVGEFGRHRGESLFQLMKALDRVDGVERFRISSIEPNLITDEMIEWMATESRRFMPHFHIPLQSGSDRVLRAMNRRYDTSLFASKISKIRCLLPDAFIGVDVIAGARGETPEEWSRSFHFIDDLDISRLHVFPYSERPGTAALLLGDAVEKGERNRRAAELISLSDRKMKAFAMRCDTQVRPVLWEHRVKGTARMSGLTDNYLRVEAPLIPDLINKISRVEISGIPLAPEIFPASHITHSELSSAR